MTLSILVVPAVPGDVSGRGGRGAGGGGGDGDPPAHRTARTVSSLFCVVPHLVYM